MAPTQVFFADSQHGWILWRYTVMHSSLYVLLSTTNGGRTWKPLAEPPGSGPMQFLSATDGWIIGGPKDEEGIGQPDNVALWNTHDGGASWKLVPIPIPKNPGPDEEDFYLIGLKFRNMQEGMVAAGVQRTHRGVFASCFTQDGGKTWQFSRFNASNAEPSIGDRHIFWSADYVEGQSDIRMDSEPIPFVYPAGVSLSLNVDFLNDSYAWLSDGKGLIATTDRGQTSKFIWPPND